MLRSKVIGNNFWSAKPPWNSENLRFSSKQMVLAERSSTGFWSSSSSLSKFCGILTIAKLSDTIELPTSSRRHISIFPCPHYKRRLFLATPLIPWTTPSKNQCFDQQSNKPPDVDGDDIFQDDSGNSFSSFIEDPQVGNTPQLSKRYSSAGKHLPDFLCHTISKGVGSKRSDSNDESRELGKCVTSSIYMPGSSSSGGTGIRRVNVDYSVEGRPLTIREINALKKTFHHKIWKALCACNWDSWEKLFSQFRKFGLPYDEVSYTLKLHGYVLSHRHKSENAYLVLEEMKQAQMHPAIIRLNEGMLNSYFELHDIFCGPTRVGFQTLCRLAWHTAVRLRRRREKRLRRSLYKSPPNEVLSMTKEDMYELLEREYVEALLPPPAAMGGTSPTALLETPYNYGDEDAEEAHREGCDQEDDEDICADNFESELFLEAQRTLEGMNDVPVMEILTKQNHPKHQQYSEPTLAALQDKELDDHGTPIQTSGSSMHDMGIWDFGDEMQRTFGLPAGPPTDITCPHTKNPDIFKSPLGEDDVDTDDEIDYLESGDRQESESQYKTDRNASGTVSPRLTQPPTKASNIPTLHDTDVAFDLLEEAADISLKDL